MSGVKDMIENRFGPAPAPSDPEGYSLWLCGSSPIKENREKLRLLASTDTVERLSAALRGFEVLAAGRANRGSVRSSAGSENSGVIGQPQDDDEDEEDVDDEEEELLVDDEVVEEGEEGEDEEGDNDNDNDEEEDDGINIQIDNDCDSDDDGVDAMVDDDEVEDET